MTAPPTPGARPAGRFAAMAIALLALLAVVVLPGRAGGLLTESGARKPLFDEFASIARR